MAIGATKKWSIRTTAYQTLQTQRAKLRSHIDNGLTMALTNADALLNAQNNLSSGLAEIAVYKHYDTIKARAAAKSAAASTLDLTA